MDNRIYAFKARLFGRMNSIPFFNRYSSIIILLLICLAPFFQFYSENCEAIGGVSAQIYLDPETKDQVVGISENDPVLEVKVRGQINITSTLPHVLQNVIFTFELRIVTGLYYMEEHLQDNYEIEPDPLAISNIMPNTEYQLLFEITIIVDKYFEPAEYGIIIESSWSVQPGSVQGTMQDSDRFYVKIARYEDVVILGDEEALIDKEVGGSYNLNIVNNGNIYVWNNYVFSGREEAEEKGIIITGSQLSYFLEPGEENTFEVYIECNNADVGATSKITFIWYKDSEWDEEWGRVETTITVTGGKVEEPVDAGINIEIEEAYYVVFRDSDSYGIEFKINGITSGCDELHVYLGVQEDSWEKPDYQMLVTMEMDIEGDITDPDTGNVMSERVYFKDTSSRGDWSGYEYLHRISISGTEEEIASGYMDLLIMVGVDVAVKVLAFPESGNENLYSQEEKYFSITAGDRTDQDDISDEYGSEPVKLEEGNSFNIYLIVGITVAVALIVMIFVFVIISRRGNI